MFGRHTAPVCCAVIARLQTLLQSRQDVRVPELAITLHFDSGVTVECEQCAVIWRARLGQFHQNATWQCPFGCDPRQPPSLPQH
jgi:hypothetical protein